MPRRRTIFLLLILIGATLFANNPGPSDMREHLKVVVAQEIEKESAAWGPGVTAAVKLAAPFLVSQITIERRNYVLFSIYKLGLTFGDAPHPKIPQCFLGIAGWFAVIERC